MRKYVLAALLGIASVSVAGCNSAWWQNFANDPVQGVQTFESAIQVSITGAQLAWPAIVASLPPANQAEATKQFTLAISAVNHALQVLNDGVTAAVNLKSPSPNFNTLMQTVSDAVAQVIAVVDQFKTQRTVSVTPGATPPAPPPGYEDMKASYASLKSFGVKVK